jgi:sulfatase maturation enzyme AslB (radical SAM superfamily)
MRTTAIFNAWGRILRGYKPCLSIEITKECPLRCPGCYAYAPGHLNDEDGIQSLHEWQGTELVERTMALVRRFRPLHVSIVGGEPLVRYKEVTRIIGRLDELGIETQVVTSAVRPIPDEWKKFSNLHLAVSVDGLRAEHDTRRAPATYDRILRNIDGHVVNVHCTITRQFLAEPDYLEEFVRTWSLHKNVRKIWFSLFTPQKGEFTPERLTPECRTKAIDKIAGLHSRYPKLFAPGIWIHGYRHPPKSPSECIFAQVTQCFAADLSTPVVPCQIGGNPECAECGCAASAGLASIGRFKLAGLLKVSDVFSVSRKLGERLGAGNAAQALKI